MRCVCRTVAILGALILRGCSQGPRTVDTAVIHTSTGAVTFVVEVADTDEARAGGLMFRKEMPETHGMLFVFDDEQPRSFWMKNTYIPLDIIFMTSRGRIASIVRNAKPMDATPLLSAEPARYALEINAGAADRHNIRPGDKADLRYK